MPAFKGHNVGWVAVVVLLLLIILTTCLLVGIDGNEDISVPPTTDPSTRTPTPTNATSALAAISPKNNSAVSEASEDPLIGGVSTVGALTTTTSQMPSTITANVSISTEDAATSATTKTTATASKVEDGGHCWPRNADLREALKCTTEGSVCLKAERKTGSCSAADDGCVCGKVATDGKCFATARKLQCTNDNESCLENSRMEACSTQNEDCICGKVATDGKCFATEQKLQCAHATESCLKNTRMEACSTQNADCICGKVVYDGICSTTNGTKHLDCEDPNHSCLNSAKDKICNATNGCVCANPSFPHCSDIRRRIWRIRNYTIVRLRNDYDVVVRFYDDDEDDFIHALMRYGYGWNVDDVVVIVGIVINDGSNVYDDVLWSDNGFVVGILKFLKFTTTTTTPRIMFRNGTYEGRINDRNCRWNATIGDECTDDDGDGWLEGTGCGDMKFLCCAEEVKLE